MQQRAWTLLGHLLACLSALLDFVLKLLVVFTVSAARGVLRATTTPFYTVWG